jgi:hypothetical protein
MEYISFEKDRYFSFGSKIKRLKRICFLIVTSKLLVLALYSEAWRWLPISSARPLLFRLDAHGHPELKYDCLERLVRRS